MVTYQNLQSDEHTNKRIRLLTELALYVYLLYSLTSVNFQIYVPYIAPIFLLVSVILSGLVGLGSWAKSTVLYLVLITSVIFIGIQIFIFHLDIFSAYVRTFPTWIMLAIIVFPLAKDEAFLKRLALVIAFAFLIQIPYLTPTIGASVTRLRFTAGSTSVDNANDLAAWLGFCFVVLWMWLWNSRPRISMLFLIAIALGILTMLLSTITRGALIGILIAILINTRAVSGKKRVAYLCALLSIVAIVWIVPYTRSILLEYQARLFEDTGRAALLNMGWNALKAAPFWGYGADNIYFRLSMETIVGPHNPFLLIGLSSGFIPLFTFCLLWLSVFIHLARRKFAYGNELDGLALFVYTAFVSLLLNTMFASVWVISVLFFISQSPNRQDPPRKTATTSLVTQTKSL